MSRRLFLAFVILAGIVGGTVAWAQVAHATSFTPGNLVIYRVGDGTGSLANTGNPVFLDEYTTSGTLVQSIPMPTTVSGSNKQLVASGTATSEGFLTLSSDRQYLVLAGYAASIPYASSLPATASATVNRTVGRVDVSGNIDTSTALSDFASAGNPRSVASTDGADLWVSGSTNGVRYTTLGSTTSTQLSTSVTNLRQLKIAVGQLYVTTSSGSTVRLGTVGTGTPTTSGQTITNLPGFPTSGSPYSFYFADLDPAVAGMDTLYVADDTASTGGVQKYSLVGGNWTLNGTIDAGSNSYRGLVGIHSGSTVTLYATRKGGSGATGGGEFASIVDSSGYNATPASPVISLLATTGANTAFRGVAFAPGTLPNAITLRTLTAMPASLRPLAALPILGLVALAGLAVYRRRRVARR